MTGRRGKDLNSGKYRMRPPFRIGREDCPLALVTSVPGVTQMGDRPRSHVGDWRRVLPRSGVVTKRPGGAILEERAALALVARRDMVGFGFPALLALRLRCAAGTCAQDDVWGWRDVTSGSSSLPGLAYRHSLTSG